MKCQEFNYYDDMYPEFAPEPIVVKCTEEVTHIVVLHGPAFNHNFMMPLKGVTERHELRTCGEHYAQLSQSPMDFGERIVEVRQITRL